MIKTLINVLCVSIIISGCSSEKKSVKSRTALCKELYDNVKTLYDEKEYFDLQEDVNELLNTCTGTGVMEDAQFILAESYFNLESWIEARSEYSIFVSHYPNSPKAAEASYKKGFSSYSNDYVPGRDGSNTSNSLNDFNDFIIQYPESQYVDSAKILIKELKERLASADMNTAQLYLTMGKPLAAAIYLKDFIVEHPNSVQVDKAYIMLIECYTRIQQFNQALHFIEQVKERDLSEPNKERFDEAVKQYNEEYALHGKTIKQEKEKKKAKRVEF